MIVAASYSILVLCPGIQILSIKIKMDLSYALNLVSPKMITREI